MKKAILFLLVVFQISCANERAPLLIGNWQCAEITEEGVALKINFADVKFRFDETGFYQYQSTLAYKEEGTYRLQRDLLYTTDTLDKTAVEKVVRITSITVDSMYLKMNDSGRERIMRLFKVQ